MIKRIIALSGLILFIVAIVCAISLSVASRQAAQLNAIEHTSGGGPPIPPCDFSPSSINAPSVMSDQESEVVSVTLSQPGYKPGTPPNPRDPGCLEMVSISVPTTIFDLSSSPSNGLSTTPTLPANIESTTVKWIIVPKKQGLYQIEVIGDNVTYTRGINVTNVFGLNVWEAELLTNILHPLGVLFIAIITAPWWLDRVREWLGKRRKRTASTSTSEKSTIAPGS